jgi:hypothetical protein
MSGAMDINAVRLAIAAAARTTAHSPALTCTEYEPDSITEPHFFVTYSKIEYHNTFGGQILVTFPCRLLIGRPDDKSSQDILTAFLHPSGVGSLVAAIEGARNVVTGGLGGLVDDLWVTEASGPRYFDHAGIQYVGSDITIMVKG